MMLRCHLRDEAEPPSPIAAWSVDQSCRYRSTVAATDNSIPENMDDGYRSAVPLSRQ